MMYKVSHSMPNRSNFTMPASESPALVNSWRQRVREEMAALLMDGIKIEEKILGDEMQFNAVCHSYSVEEVKELMGTVRKLQSSCDCAETQKLLATLESILVDG